MTKVAPERLRKASVAEHMKMSWDITTKEKALFEMTLDNDNLSWKEPLLDKSGEFHESETPDTMARPQNLEEEVNSQMNDDGYLPFSEPPVPRKDDHSEDETQVEEPDPVTEESRDVVREPSRLPQCRRKSKQPPSSEEAEEGVESKSKKGHASMCQSCCTTHFSHKPLDPKRSNGMA